MSSACKRSILGTRFAGFRKWQLPSGVRLALGRHGPKLGSHEAKAFTKLEAKALTLDGRIQAAGFVLHSSTKIGCKVEALLNHEAEAFGNHKAEARLPKI